LSNLATSIRQWYNHSSHLRAFALNMESVDVT